MILNKIFFPFLVFFAMCTQAQTVDSLGIRPLSQYPQDQLRTDEYGQKYFYDERQKAKIYEINGETVVVMDELRLVNKPKFNNQLDKNFYLFLILILKFLQ